VAAALAAAAAAPLLLTSLGTAPFDDPGEGMHAEIARELWNTGARLPLTLDGVPYVDKPPLLYAALTGAFSLLAPDESAARLVSALAALLAIGATAWLGARLMDGRGGVVAGLALLTSLGFFVYGRYVRPDTLFIAAITVGFALALPGVVGDRRLLVALGLVAFGVAALTKDPLGVVAPPLAIGLALALRGDGKPVGRWLPWYGVVFAVLIAFGWWIEAERATPGFIWYTVVDNHLLNVVLARRFPDEDVPLRAGEFVIVALLGAAPWIIPAAGCVGKLVRLRAWRDPAETPWVILGVWAVGVLAITTVVPFRLPHYGLPAYPALALLAARGWRDIGVRGLAWVHATLFAVLAFACLVAWTTDASSFMAQVLGAVDVATRKAEAAGVPATIPPWSAFRPLVGATTLALLGGALVLAVAAVMRLHAVAVYGTILTLALVLPSAAGALGLVATQRAVKGLGEEIARRAGTEDLVVHEGPLENAGALPWYSGHQVVIVNGRRSVLGFGGSTPAAPDVMWEAPRLRLAWLGPRRVWLVTGRPPELSVVADLPGARLVAAGGGRRLYVNR
jgi:hypothetical protein